MTFGLGNRCSIQLSYEGKFNFFQVVVPVVAGVSAFSRTSCRGMGRTRQLCHVPHTFRRKGHHGYQV